MDKPKERKLFEQYIKQDFNPFTPWHAKSMFKQNETYQNIGKFWIQSVGFFVFHHNNNCLINTVQPDKMGLLGRG